jgi:hypothetical protein
MVIYSKIINVKIRLLVDWRIIKKKIARSVRLPVVYVYPNINVLFAKIRRFIRIN